MAAVARLGPELAVHAGAGILRRALLEVPRLGTLNAHMGLLPYYRGMNVCEWAAFNGDPVGCTVHLIDPGIDTGDILCVRELEEVTASDIRELRRQVDDLQLALLGEVLQYVLSTGELPPRRVQQPREGMQFFRMRREIAQLLDLELGRAALGKPV